MINKPKVLFIMYDGLTDPLGQSQVLSYLRHLSRDYSFDVIGYEKPEIFEASKNNINKEITNLDITWFPIKYHKKPPILSTIYDFYVGWKVAKIKGDLVHYDVIHCRSSAIGSVALRLKKRYQAKLIFDMRGWWADEKKDSGAWSSIIFKPIYIYFKNLERKLFQDSDHAISLTSAGYNEILEQNLKSSNQLSIIPTCVDFEIFKPFDQKIREDVRIELDISLNDKVILYSGSLGGNYSINTIVDSYKASKELLHDTKILIISHTDSSYIFSELERYNIPIDDIRIKKCNYNEVFRYLMVGDVGVINYHQCFSSIGRSPTKMGEYWACGLPVICKKNTGDVDYLIEKYPNSGYMIDTDNARAYEDALRKIYSSGNYKNLLRDYSLDCFDLLKGVEVYKSVYSNLLNTENS
jgi:glycosyltransferase involved in cell wall biosynthesis